MTDETGHEAQADRRSNGRRCRIARLAMWIAVGAALLTLAARLWSGTGWAVDLVATFAAQWAVISLVLCVVGFVVRARAAGVALALIAGVHIAWLGVGRADRWSGPVDESRIVRVMTFNYLGENRQFEALQEYLLRSEADVVVILEVPDELTEMIQGSHVLRERFPYQSLPKHAAHWNRIKLSVWPIVEPNLIRYENPGEKFDYVAGRSAIVESPGGKFVLTSILPPSPRSPAKWAEGNRAIRFSGTILRERLVSLGHPVVLCMDLNATPSGYRTRLVRQVTGLERTKPAWSLRGTWPSWMPAFARVAIDDVLVSDGVAVRSWSTEEEALGSDHVPVLVELVLPEPRRGGENGDAEAAHTDRLDAPKGGD